MTDRINSITVVLEKDVREDDSEALLSAIRQLRGVVSVTGNVCDITSHIAEVRARTEIGAQIMAVLYPTTGRLP